MMNLGNAAGGGEIKAGPDLEEVQTERLGFHAAAGEDKLRLLVSPWPSDKLPTPTSSLLSIAPTKGLLAAASPASLVIASTESVRQTFVSGPAAPDGSKAKSYTPQATLSVPRVSQVCFSSDESCLVIAAEQGGGLAVYDTNALGESAQPAFQLGTQGQQVRQLLPNPNPSADTSRFFAVVTDNGQLLLADLKEQKLVQGSSGNVVFHEQVSCASWSRLGKQIVAGLADGSAVQIDQQGVVKATIPAPPQLAQLRDPNASAYPITSIFWLETFDFLIIHTPINPPDSMGSDDSLYHLAHKDKATQSWTFSRFQDPCPPWGVDRKPAHHFVQRLREWPPALSDMLILSATSATDIGVFTRSSAPLNSQNPITDTFTYTQPLDQRRAALPMGQDGETSPIGMVVDLSVREKAPAAFHTDEGLKDSPVELPALYALDNEGILSMWWIVYDEATKQSIRYPDLVVAGGPRSLTQGQAQASTPVVASQQASASSPFGSVNAPANVPASSSTFGQPSFGASTTPAFGGTSALGGKPSPWGGAVSSAGPTFGTPSFGKPSFGTPSAGIGFGQVGGMGANKASVWGSPNTQTPTLSSVSVFGGNASNQSAFSTMGKPAASPFASFAAGNKDSQASPFAAKPKLPAEPSGSTVSFGTGSSFGSVNTFGGGQTSSLFGNPGQNGTSFGKPPTVQPSREETMEEDPPSAPKPAEGEKPTNVFGLGSSGFKFTTAFKGDGTAKDDLPKPEASKGGLFGNAFTSALGETPKEQPSTPVKKEPGTDEEPKLSDIPEAKTVPPAPASPPKEQVEEPEEAPLPPDFTTWKPKPGALPAPVPPGFGAEFGAKKESANTEDKKVAEAEAAPLPPDFNQKPSDHGDRPAAGTPPVDLGSENFSEGIASDEAGPPETDDEGEAWSDEDDDGGEEDEQDGEEEEHEIRDQKGLDAFKSRITPASPSRPEPSTHDSSTPETSKKSSYTPAGLPKAPIMFAPPSKQQESPRSPSPVRSATSPQRLMAQGFGQRSSQQAVTSANRSRQSSQAKQPPQPSHSQRVSVPPSELVSSQRASRAPKQQEPESPAEGELEDDEDARIQAILVEPIEPTTDVPEFLAHQEYASDVGRSTIDTTKAGLGGQIERVYRDVNAMIDTVALNARAMAGFVKGNAPTADSRARDELVEEESWHLGDAEHLDGILQEIEGDLEDGKLDNVHHLLVELNEESRRVTQIKSKAGEFRKQIATRSDPEHLANQQAAPLPLETATQLSELRQGVQKVQTLLAKAESQLSVLRAEIASASARSSAKSSAATPTVEAVTNTVLKMTAMIEKKSGDIDVLESQIRRLGGVTALTAGSTNLAEGYEDDLVSSMKASRLSYASPARNSRSPGLERKGWGSSARKPLMKVDDEQLEVFSQKRERRKRVANGLRDLVERRGVRIVRIGG